MRAWIGLPLLVALAGSLAAGGRLGAPVRGMRSPGDYPEGLAWDGTHLWCNNFTDGALYRLDPRDGSVVGRYTGGLLPAAPEGLAWDGTHLWTCDWRTGVISKVLPSAGGVQVVQQFPPPAGAGGTVGLEWDGTHIWLATWGAVGDKSQLFKLHPGTLEVVQWFRLPVWWVEDLAWDGHHLWSVDWQFSIGFAIDTTTGDTLHTYRTPGPSPVGMAWDGTHLWLSDTTKDSLWALDISSARPTPVQRLSWSEFKRSYR